MLRQVARFRGGQNGNVKWVLATVVVLALVISPLAVAQTTGLIAASAIRGPGHSARRPR